MRRREFIAMVGGATVAWPVAARAQQNERKRRVGVLMGLAADDAQAQDRIVAFEQGLQQLGWIDGRNLQIDYRRGAGDTDPTRKYAAELVALGPDVILASGGSVVGTLLQATRTVPIVFTQTPDPVAAGFVASLATARRQRHRFYNLRIRDQREMAGAAQRDRAGRDTGGGPSGSHHSCRDWPVHLNPVRSAVARGGIESDRLARRQRDRARRHVVRARIE